MRQTEDRPSRLKWITALVSVASCTATTTRGDAPVAVERPNIIFLLADDLGYGDLGCFGQTRFRTPNIDALAASGMRLTQHYSGAPVCAPSRCVLMTGKHSGHAFIRDNRSTPPEGQYPIPSETVTLPKLLKKLGYVTGGFGKWGLGGPGSTGEPLRQGMDRFFGYNCQGVAHNFYPTYLWDNDQRVALDNPPFASNQKFPADADPRDAASFARYTGRVYAPDRISEQARRFLRDNKDRPFFLYYPTTVPHLALQVPEDSLAEFRGVFPESPYLGDRGYLPHATPRAAYAAMITRLDREIGQIVRLVRELGIEQRTVFIFSSDNGPLYNELGGTDCDFFQSARSFRGRKGSVYEGGMRVPTIVSWSGTIATGTTSARLSGFEDWLPTLLELVGAAELTPNDVDGISLAATLRGMSQAERPFLYREFRSYGGQQCVRLGDWKGVRQDLLPRGRDAKPNLHIELFDLAADPNETTDVSDKHPEIIAKMQEVLREQHTPSAEFPIPAIDR